MAASMVAIIGLSGEWRTIVGVVSDVREHGPDQAPPVAVFQPLAQELGASALVVRTEQEPGAVSRSVVDAIRRLEADQPVQAIATLEQVRTESIAPQRLNVTLLGVFALLAMVISAVGVAGLLSFSVSTRAREFGIRAALGADRRRLLAGIVREGVVLAAFGLVLGAAGAMALTRLLRGFLFGVEPTDPVTFVAVGVLLAGVAALASLVPAWKASQADPATVLRSE